MAAWRRYQDAVGFGMRAGSWFGRVTVYIYLAAFWCLDCNLDCMVYGYMGWIILWTGDLLELYI